MVYDRKVRPVLKWIILYCCFDSSFSFSVCFFCFNSDGVWDVMSLADVGEIIERVAAKNPAAWSPQRAASVIVSTARHRWLRTPQALGRVDDITALVVRIKH